MNNNEPAAFESLVGQFLVAMPAMDDPRFAQSVIYIYSHTETDGALGLVINKPADKLLFRDILEQMHIPVPEKTLPPLLLGGPEQMTHGFILHSPDYKTPLTRIITDGVSLTATQDILQDIVLERGPSDFLLTLGCAGWRRGQLEDELMSNVWLTVPASCDILFKTPYARRWHDALKSVGIDDYRLSEVAGKA